MAITGCFIGHAVGDALGFIVEGYPRSVCINYVNTIILPKRDPIMKRLPQFTFGQYSDDTQLVRELLLTVMQTRGMLDPNVYAARIAGMFVPNMYRVVGYGEQTARAAQAIRMGVHHSESGCKTGQGNGGVMRSDIVGLLVNEPDIDQSAVVLSAITHASPRCLDAAIAIARATRFAAYSTKVAFDIDAFFEYILAGALQTLDLREDLKQVWDLVKDAGIHPLDAADLIIARSLERGERDWNNTISCGVGQSSLWALYSVCKASDSFVECMAMAICPGGDVDSTAAMAGGIIGARLGIEAIPGNWMAALHDIDEWDKDALVGLVKHASDLLEK